MSDVIAYSAAFAAGVMLGAGYFGGLWLTVLRLSRSKRPATLTMGSFVIRMTFTGVVFFHAARGGHWDRLIVVLAGFLMVRWRFIHAINNLRNPGKGPHPRDIRGTGNPGCRDGGH